jgi:hypothetical protein
VVQHLEPLPAVLPARQVGIRPGDFRQSVRAEIAEALTDPLDLAGDPELGALFLALTTNELNEIKAACAQITVNIRCRWICEN